MKNSYFGTFIVHTVFVLLLHVINYSHSIDTSNKDDQFTIDVTMTNILTVHQDQYAFVQYKLPDEELMVVGYSPLTEMNVAHHMLTYACALPASNKPFWIDGASCAGEQMIIHGWARNAPPLILPEDVGFAVGKNTPYKYIVVNIHYLAIVTGDNSGNQLILTRKLRKYRAGVMLGASGAIALSPKTKTIRVPFSCHYSGPPISIFAVRVHAHQWARVNSLYRVRNKTISQIVKSNPQWPQSFYPLPHAAHIENDDSFVGQCVYDNNENRVIYSGSTHTDEMCNVYSMYSYDPAKTLNGLPPIMGCWGSSIQDLVSLMPPDSVFPPDTPADIGGTRDNGSLYINVENWPDVQSLPSQLGQIGGIALNNANNELVVFHRGSRRWESQYFDGFRFRNEAYGPIEEDVLIHIDTQTGQVKSRWGAKMFYMSHGLTIDHQGNFWLTDVAMHQVFMFKPNNLTHPALIVGEEFRSGSGQTQFCQPADVAVMKNGDFFVADGYCNSRIMKFNQKGEFIMKWGFPLSGKLNSDGLPLGFEWNIVHSLALNEDARLICGADRENSRIQCFYPDTGDFVRQIYLGKKGISNPIYAIEFAPKANDALLFAVTGGGQTITKNVYVINAKNGEVLTSFDTKSHMTAPHDLTVSSNANEIYVGELALSPANALHKFELFKKQELSIKLFDKHTLFNKKHILLLLIIMIVCCTLLLITLITCCIIRKRKQRRLQYLGINRVDIKPTHMSSESMFGNWINRQKNFERLDEDMEEENQLLDFDEDHQPSDSIVGNEKVIIKSKKQTTAFNKNNNTIKLKMGDSL